MSLTPDLQKIIADLDAKINSGDYNQHAVDVFVAIKACIPGCPLIGRDFQHSM